jgi:hypothetical protein
MLKKLMILSALVLFAFSMTQAKSVICGGGRFVFQGADSDAIGVGTFADFGVELNPGEYPRLIAWIQYDGEKSDGTIDVDNVTGNVSYLTNHLIKKAKMGSFLTVGAGGGKVEREDVKISILLNAGAYFDLTDETQIQIGVNSSNVGKYTTYGLKLGVAIYH